MNKNDLVATVADMTGLPKAKVAKAVDGISDVITGALKNGEKVQLVGFGSFSIVNRSARQGRNPRTGATIQVAASRQPKFKAGKAFKDAVNA